MTLVVDCNEFFKDVAVSYVWYESSMCSKMLFIAVIYWEFHSVFTMFSGNVRTASHIFKRELLTLHSLRMSDLVQSLRWHTLCWK